jgi:hypothetical protein
MPIPGERHRSAWQTRSQQLHDGWIGPLGSTVNQTDPSFAVQDFVGDRIPPVGLRRPRRHIVLPNHTQRRRFSEDVVREFARPGVLFDLTFRIHLRATAFHKSWKWLASLGQDGVHDQTKLGFRLW